MRLKPFFLTWLGTVGVALALTATPARAWLQLEPGIKWPDGSVPMVLMFGPNKTLFDGTTWNLSAQIALDEWNRNMGRVQFTWTTSSGTTGGENNTINEAFFAGDAYGDAFGTGTLAITIYWSTTTRITRADVIFNNKFTWDSYRGVLRYSGTTLVPEFRRVALHEFGHVLGFDHPDENNQFVYSVMNASISGVENLTENDKDGAGKIYGYGTDNQPPPTPLPSILEQPASVSVTDGSGASFSVRAGGQGTLTYQWFKNGAAIPGATSSNYAISSVAVTDEGSYTVQVTNDGGSVTSAAATLTALVPAAPRITSQPGGGVVSEGAEIWLSVSVTGAALQYRWSRNGVVLANSNSNFHRITPAHPWDSGDFFGEIFNRGGSVTTQTVHIDVRPVAPPVINNEPAFVVFRRSAGLRIAVGASGGDPLAYAWTRNAVTVQSLLRPSATLELADSAAQAGNYALTVSNGAGAATTGTIGVTERPDDGTTPAIPVLLQVPRVVRQWQGYVCAFPIVADGAGTLAYQWKKSGVALPGATSANFSIPAMSAADAGKYTVVVSNAAGSVESGEIACEYLGVPGLPRFSTEPQNQAAVVGKEVLLRVSAYGSPVPTVQWRKNGVPISGATGWELALRATTLADSGTYDVVATNSLGTATSRAANVTIAVDNGRIVALSARAQVGTGSDVLIPGFNVGGTVPKKLLIRALGPALAQYGVPGTLADPRLELKALGGSTVIASNNDWSGAGVDPSLPALFTQVGASALSAGSKDAALVATLSPGLYTAVTSGADGGSGVALLEVYDVDPAAGKLTGISTRAIVGTGSNVLIPGIVVEGPVAKKLLIRVSGPALAAYGVGGTLADPKLELTTLAGAPIAANNNWDKTDAALTTATAQIGLNAFADGSKDAAILATLSAGLYTIVISGADGGSGVALVEVYDVP